MWWVTRRRTRRWRAPSHATLRGRLVCSDCASHLPVFVKPELHVVDLRPVFYHWKPYALKRGHIYLTVFHGVNVNLKIVCRGSKTLLWSSREIRTWLFCTAGNLRRTCVDCFNTWTVLHAEVFSDWNPRTHARTQILLHDSRQLEPRDVQGYRRAARTARILLHGARRAVFWQRIRQRAACNIYLRFFCGRKRIEIDYVERSL